MGRVYIAVRLETTGVTAENLLRLSQRVFDDDAAKTGLALRIPTIGNDDARTIHSRLVFELSSEIIKAGIADAPCRVRSDPRCR